VSALSSWFTRWRLYGVAAGNGLYLAAGAKGAILTSSDALHWTNQISTVTNTLLGATFGAGQFVVVGDADTLLTSPDGMAWTQRFSSTNRALRAAAYGNGQFIAVGDEGTVVRSSDGVNWTSSSLSTTNRLTDITYAAGLFVAVAGPGTGFGTIYISPNGLTWSIVATTVVHDLWVAFGAWEVCRVGIGACHDSTNG
jgi:hypothetical protein